VSAELVLEPLTTGVRVTARDAQHRVLGGYVGSKETVRQSHCLVAIYDTLQDLLAEELETGKFSQRERVDVMADAKTALDTREGAVQWRRESLEVKKVRGATAERASSIARIAHDANRQITLEAQTLKGMKSKSAAGDITPR